MHSTQPQPVYQEGDAGMLTAHSGLVSGSHGVFPVSAAWLLQAWMCVSHFNLIHTSCHQAARVADSGLRAPKREWEGATLRNGETLCNNLLPLKAAGVSDTVHAAAVATFMEQLHKAPYR